MRYQVKKSDGGGLDYWANETLGRSTQGLGNQALQNRRPGCDLESVSSHLHYCNSVNRRAFISGPSHGFFNRPEDYNVGCNVG
jgi:hypothetical protein